MNYVSIDEVEACPRSGISLDIPHIQNVGDHEKLEYVSESRSKHQNPVIVNITNVST